MSACSGRNYNFRCKNKYICINVFWCVLARTAAKSRTNLSTNSGTATKRLGRLAPNLAHVQIHMGMDIRQTNCPSRHKGVFGGQQFKSLGKLSDWHQLWFTSADSSGNGHRLNTSRPSIPQVAFRRLNTSRPSIPQVAFRGGGGVTNSKVWGNCQTAGPIGPKFGTQLQIYLGMDIRQTNCPSRQKGALGGGVGVKHSKVWGSCQTAGLIGTNFCSRLQIHLGMDTR